jgi:hypothetical protein
VLRHRRGGGRRLADHHGVMSTTHAPTAVCPEPFADTFVPHGGAAAAHNRSSRYRGVRWDKRREKWIAQIIFNKQPRYLGQFDDEIGAARAYDDAARQLFGTGRTLNFPTEAERQRADSGAPPECPNLPAGMIERRQALATFDLIDGTFSHWEKKGWITCGRLVTVPGRPGRTKVYPPEELRREIEALREGPEFPPPGYVDLDAAPEFFDVSAYRWREWERAGQLTTGEMMTPKGQSGRKKVYPIEATRSLVEELKKEAEFPPPGHVDWDEAIRMAGVTQTKWMKWQREGRITCGEWLPIPQPPGKKKAYPIEELRREIEQARNPVFPPPGFVGREEAARMFGVSQRTLSHWEERGRVRCGRSIAAPDRPGRVKLYPVDAVRRLVEEFKQVPVFPPPGFVGREDACRMFGVALKTWTTWESEGRITCGMFALVPNRPGQCKIYPIEELERVRAEFQRAEAEEAKRLEPYPDPQRPGCWRVPIRSRLHADKEAIIDEESLPLVQGKQWNWVPGKNGSHGSVMLAGTGSDARPLLHQIIMGVRGKENRIGHLNDDPLDCRKENLVVRTHREQAASRKKSPVRGGKPCSSRFKGVTLADSGRKWNAAISMGEGGRRRTVQLGLFRSELDAALAYDHAARELYGGHARLNVANDAELERLRAEDKPFEPLYDEFPPPGWMDRDDAAAMFGVSVGTWGKWDADGRIKCGRFFPMPDDKPGRCKLYPIADLERLREEISQLGKPYADPDRPGCWRVPLKGYLEYREAIIDAESLPIVEGKNWNWAPREEGIGVPGQVILATLASANPALSRLVAGVEDSDLHVQFRNGDPLDCRKENLFVKTLQEQVFGNKKFRSINGRNCTSKYKGVCWDRRRGLWVAQIVKDQQHHALGRFDTEIEAAWAYDEAALELFGADYAWFNFPGGKPREAGEYAPTDERELEMPVFEMRKSKYIGVSWEKYSRKWLVMFTANGKQKNLGLFEDEVEAAKAHDAAAREARGEWAWVNFPTEQESRFHAQWYDRDRACKFFGVTRNVWKRWVKERKTPAGRIAYFRGSHRSLYTLPELEWMKQRIFGESQSQSHRAAA